MKKITKEITTNKILKTNQTFIDNIRKTGCSYFEFNKTNLQEIAKKNIEDLSRDEWFTITQALFPEYLICSGLFDSFIIFVVKNGTRIDPPLYYWRDLFSFLNNDKNAKVNRLIDEIYDLFVNNNIKWHESWNQYFSKEEIADA